MAVVVNYGENNSDYYLQSKFSNCASHNYTTDLGNK